MHKLKLILIILTILSMISLSLSETHAECNARCYRENTQCCEERPNECGSTCYEAARKCYRGCNTLTFLYSDD